MIVRAKGLRSDPMRPRGRREAAEEWLVSTADPEVRSEVIAAVAARRRLRHVSVVDRWRRPSVAVRRYGFIDLVADGGAGAACLEALAAAAGAPRPWLIVHGADGDDDGELLARRAGVAVYLAGDPRPGFIRELVTEIAP